MSNEDTMNQEPGSMEDSKETSRSRGSRRRLSRSRSASSSRNSGSQSVGTINGRSKSRRNQVSSRDEEDSSAAGSSRHRDRRRLERSKSKGSHRSLSSRRRGDKQRSDKSKSKESLGSSRHRDRDRHERSKSKESSRSTRRKDEGNNGSTAFTDDQRAKARARRTSPGPAVPGAFVDSTGEVRTTRKHDRDAADREAKNRARRQTGDSKRGASRESRDRAAKNAAKSGNRAVRPGASSKTTGKRKAKADMFHKAHSSNEESKTPEGGIEVNIHLSRSIEEQPEKGKSNEQPVVAAMIVEEEKEDEDTKKERQQARIQETRIQEALAAERGEMQAERQRMKEEVERLEAERKDEQDRKAKNKRNATIILALFLIGGAVGAYFATRSREESSTVSAQDPPTNFQLKYGQPGLVECERIAAGLPIFGEDEMLDRSFNFPMEVELLPDNDINPILPELETSIERLSLPDLIGCPRDLFARRRLGDRKLQTVMSIRYAVAKATVEVTVTSDSCETSRSPSCNVVSVTLNLKVRGEEPNILLMGVIGQVFPVGKDIRPDLELIAPFETIVVGVIRPLEPTLAPTLADGAPEDKNSTSPSSAPDMGRTTLAPSQSPSSLPSEIAVLGTTSTAPTEPPTQYQSKAPEETKSPTESRSILPTDLPTLAPSDLPTLAPTPTPPPTAAPQPGRTPLPTALPSASPSRSPSKNPTRSPSLKPTPRPSPFPSIRATAPPSSVPSNRPTSGPTLNPSVAPTSSYLGCFQDDDSNPVLDVLATGSLDVEGCRDFCSTIGYPYSAIQDGNQCWCGNDYDLLGIANDCNSACGNNADVYCGGAMSNSVYLSGASANDAVVPALESDLYCGCTKDSSNNRDLEHRAPYYDLSQQGCILYCRANGYDFAGLQSAYVCYCGNDPGSQSFATNCNQGCAFQGASSCYDGRTSCTCGGSMANSLFRTSSSVICPSGAYLISGDYATASFNVPVYQPYGFEAAAMLAIDGDNCGEFWTCRSTAHTPENTNDPAMTIDLGFLATVGKVVVWNRSDCCMERTIGFILELLDPNQNVKSGSARTLTSAREQPFVFTGMTNVRYVRIRTEGPGVLNIAEVQVFS